MKDEQSPFWEFSLRFYARPRAAPACLELQDRAGVDVNVMLYLLFLAHQGRQLDRDNISLIDATVNEWRDQVVKPLRTIRRRLKDGMGPVDLDATAALRTEVKRIELEAERIEQHTLEQLVPASGIGKPASSRATAARENLTAYGKLLGGLPAGPVETLLEIFTEE